MNTYKAQIDILRVIVGDSFEQEFTIYSLYPLADVTEILLVVRPVGDIPESPVLTFSKTEGSITVTGQKINLIKQPSEMQVRTGQFVYDCTFYKEAETTTLFGGIFETISSTQQTNL